MWHVDEGVDDVLGIGSRESLFFGFDLLNIDGSLFRLESLVDESEQVFDLVFWVASSLASASRASLKGESGLAESWDSVVSGTTNHGDDTSFSLGWELVDNLG